MYEVTCPSCGAGVRSPFVRLGAVTVCARCRTRYQVSQGMVKRVAQAPVPVDAAAEEPVGDAMDLVHMDSPLSIPQVAAAAPVMERAARTTRQAPATSRPAPATPAGPTPAPAPEAEPAAPASPAMAELAAELQQLRLGDEHFLYRDLHQAAEEEGPHEVRRSRRGAGRALAQQLAQKRTRLTTLWLALALTAIILVLIVGGLLGIRYRDRLAQWFSPGAWVVPAGLTGP